MSNYFETLQQNPIEAPKYPEEEQEFKSLVFENCYNAGCEIINKDEFVHKSLTELKEHDKNTFIHSLEVGNMMAFLINKLGDKLNDKERRTLMMSALLHDYGKTSIDAQLLNKKEELTDLERKKIEEHPRHSFDALKEWDEEVARVAVAHHEHQEHSYPRKEYIDDILDKRTDKGEIRRLSRLLAMVDSFQAMMDPTRPSNIRKPKKIDQVVKELNEKKFILNEDKEVLFLLEDYYYQNRKNDGITYNNQSGLMGNA